MYANKKDNDALGLYIAHNQSGHFLRKKLVKLICKFCVQTYLFNHAFETEHYLAKKLLIHQNL